MRIRLRWLDLLVFGGPAVAIGTGVAIARSRKKFSLGDELPANNKFQPPTIQGGARKPSDLKLIVLHSTESSGTAAAVASWFQSPDAGGSTQLICGEDGCYRSVPDLRVPAGAPGANQNGLHLEIVGRASWTNEEWRKNAPRALALAARALAYWSRKYGIPLHYVDADELRRNPDARGVTTHADVSRAFKKSDHHDPGPGFPLKQLLVDAMEIS